jgi:glycosyltransferase involved in cell wall biosynthesis
VVLEAMASGCAVVAPNSGGVLSYANKLNAWLTNATPEDFALAIKDAVENRHLREIRTQNAIRTALENSKENAIRRLFETYDRMYEEFSRLRSTAH